MKIVPSLPIRSDDPTLQRFLIPSVLEKLKEKKSVVYEVETADGVLGMIS